MQNPTWVSGARAPNFSSLRELFVWSRPRCAPLPFALRAGGVPPPEIRAARPPASDAHHPPPAAAMDISAMAEVTQSAGLAELIEKGLMPSQKKPISSYLHMRTCAPKKRVPSPFCAL